MEAHESVISRPKLGERSGADSARSPRRMTRSKFARTSAAAVGCRDDNARTSDLASMAGPTLGPTSAWNVGGRSVATRSSIAIRAQAAVSPQAIGGALIARSRSARCCSRQWACSARVSGSVTRRRHELAVRLALGADQRRVLRLVLSEGVRLVGVGLLLGVPGIYAANG
jgi:hypothetical protein